MALSVREKAARREIIRVGDAIKNAGANDRLTDAEALTKARRAFSELANSTIPPSPGDACATIRLSTAEHVTIGEAIDALATRDGDLYHRGGSLVRIVITDDSSDGIARPVGSPTIRTAPGPHLRERLTRVAQFERYDARAKGWTPT